MVVQGLAGSGRNTIYHPAIFMAVVRNGEAEEEGSVNTTAGRDVHSQTVVFALFLTFYFRQR